MRQERIILIVLIIAIFAAAGGCSTAGGVKQEQTTAEKVITDIIVMDNAVQIKASGPFSYTLYKPSDPYRVALDIPEVGTGRFSERIISKSSGITEVIPSQTESPKIASHLEVLLQNPSDIEPLYHDNVLVLKVKQITDSEGAKQGPSRSDIQTARPVLEEKVVVREVQGNTSAPSGAVTTIQAENKEETGAKKEEAAREKTDAPPLAKATEIRDLRVESVDGVVNLIIKGDGSMNPAVFTLKNRIVIDIPDVALKAKAPSTVFSPIRGVRAGKHKEKTRLVIDLKEMKGFDVLSEKDLIIVAVQSGEAGIAISQREAPGEAPKPMSAEKKEALPQRPPKPELVEKKEASPAAASAPANGGESAEIKEPEAIAEGKYTGKKISLDFQDADIVPIFRLLSDISGYNIVVNPEVKGKLTMKLINVPWDQALDLILKTFSLGKSIEGNIVRIAPLSVFAKESEDRSRAKEAEIKAEALETKIFPVSYADVSVVEKAIKDSKILSTRGSVSVDRRTSALVVKDVGSVFPQIDNLLLTLDRAIPQVMIEARIVEVSTNSVFDLGIQWGVKVNAVNTLSSLAGLPNLNRGGFTGNNFMVDFPSGRVGAGSGSGFNFGLLNPARTLGLDLQLSALEQVGGTKIISNPRLVTTDNEKATIMQGTSEPYPQLTPEGTITTAFKDIVLIAEVVPHITPAGSVSMSVLVRKEDIIGTVTIAGSPVPRTSKIESNTRVLVQSGETLVIGGVYKKTERHSASGIPGLMKVPILGSLFKSKSTSEDVSELMMFITPRIVEKE